MSLDKILELLYAHADAINQDISLAQNRDNHIRMTTRLNEATALIFAVQDLQAAEQ